MMALSRNKYSVIARLDRAIQYAAAVVFLTAAGGYWMPAFAGMTMKMRGQTT
jgi:hypothetical protein